MFSKARKYLIMGIFASVWALSAGAHAIDVATPRLKPPAPGPTYLSVSDYAQLTTLHELLKHKQFSQARPIMSRINDPVARSLGEWMYYRAEDPMVDIAKADAFLDAHPDWPAISAIQRFVEGRISWTAPAPVVLAFFDNRDPVSGDGRMLLAKALFDTGEREAALIHLHAGWVNYNFNASEEKRILSTLGKYLTADDHAARVDRLLWERQVTNARRTFNQLSPSERRKAEARAAFLLRASSAPRLYGNLSREEQLDSGVLMAAVRYYRRGGDEKRAIELSALAPNNPEQLRNASRWWYERQLLMRVSLKEGRFADAYELAAHNGLDNDGDLSEAEFNAGWIALRFLKQPERAETHFLALASAVESPISLSRAYYWAGRAAAARNDAKLETAYYTKAAQHYYSFYGQLAAEELGGDALAKTFGPVAAASEDDKALFSSRPSVKALRMLSDLRLDYEFMVFAYHIDDILDRPGEYAALAEIANGEGAPHLTVRAGKVAIRRNAFAANVAYPVVFIPDEATKFVAPEIILGLSRQESEFNPRAYSSAGARGMMQLLPSTALATARKEGLTYSRSALLDDPVYNLTIGSAHLSHLLDRFDGSLALTLAAYNAGPHRADRWIKEYGDPRSPNVDPVDWIELVPFAETRNYIQRVLENTQVYRGQLNNTPIPGVLSADIERGGPRGRAARNPLPSSTLAAKAAEHGAQQLAPLPERTLERVREFKLAEANIPSAPEAAEDAIAPEQPQAPVRRRNRGKQPSTPATQLKNGVDANAKDILTPPAAASAQTDEVLPPSEMPAVVKPAPISATGQTGASPLPAAPAINPRTAAPDEDDYIGQARALIAAESPDAQIADEEKGSDEVNEVFERGGEAGECSSYLDFLARNAEEEEEVAGDLNAIILSQLQSGEDCRVDDLPQ